MNKKTALILYAVVIIAAIILIAMVSVQKPQTQQPPIVNNAPSEDNLPITPTPIKGDSVFFGQISKVQFADGRITATVVLMDDVQGIQNMEQAAITDGVCTAEQVQKSECLNNPFYLRNTGKTVTLPVKNDADVRIYAREAAGGFKVDTTSQIYLIPIPAQDFTAMLENTDSAPWLETIPYYLTLDQGAVVGIQEKYVP